LLFSNLAEIKAEYDKSRKKAILNPKKRRNLLQDKKKHLLKEEVSPCASPRGFTLNTLIQELTAIYKVRELFEG